jgi:hypothetical protein
MVRKEKNALAPLFWKSEILGYTIPEGGRDHAESPKDLYTGV